MKPRRPWTVTPHEPLQKLEENLWVVGSQVPKVPINRRMAIVKLSDGKLLFYHAVPLEDSALAEVKAWGTPAYLVIAHDNHGVDADAFQKKLGVKLYGPKENEEKLRAKFDLDGTTDQLPKDSAFELVKMAGVSHGEPAVIVKSQARTSICFSDAMMNITKGALMMRLTGFTGGPKSPWVFRKRFVNDARALKLTFESLADIPGAMRLVPCHGDIIPDGGQAVLSKIAAKL
jgi:hypothetical protein